MIDANLKARVLSQLTQLMPAKMQRVMSLKYPQLAADANGIEDSVRSMRNLSMLLLMAIFGFLGMLYWISMPKIPLAKPTKSMILFAKQEQVPRDLSAYALKKHPLNQELVEMVPVKSNPLNWQVSRQTGLSEAKEANDIRHISELKYIKESSNLIRNTARLSRAYDYYQQSNDWASQQWYQEAWAEDKHDVSAPLALGLLAIKQRDLKQARQYFDVVLALNPLHRQAKLGLDYIECFEAPSDEEGNSCAGLVSALTASEVNVEVATDE